MKQNIVKYTVIFIFGGICYGITEILSRGFTHITMGLLGGVSFLVIHILNAERKNGISLFTVMLISGIFITSAEFLAGEILNNIMRLNIWNYEQMPLNIDGQICLPFTFIWIMLSFVGVLLDRFVIKNILCEKF